MIRTSDYSISTSRDGLMSEVKIGGLTIWFYDHEAVAFRLPNFVRPVVRKAMGGDEWAAFCQIPDDLPGYRLNPGEFEARLANATWWTGQPVPA